MEENKRPIKVKAEYLTKQYQLLRTQSEKLKAALLGKSGNAPFWALKGISFEVYDGDVVGIVGTNGSGKSTLLNVISGVIPQTTGHFHVNGDISVVTIESGFEWELTGRENIRLKQLMMGKTNKEIDEYEEQIIKFSELGEFIDQPVKAYSSGMRSKLGFAIAVHDNQDIMIIDEALSVGDAAFSQKALRKIKEIIKDGKTIFFVSHDLNQVREFTNKAMWIQFGELKEFGDTKDVADHYEEFSRWFEQLSNEDKEKYMIEERKRQESFNLNNLKEIIERKENDAQVNDLIKRKTFSGLNPIGLWTTIGSLFAVLIYLITRLF